MLQAALKLVDSDDHSEWASSSLAPTGALSATNTTIPDLATKWFYKDPQGETQGDVQSDFYFAAHC